MDLPTVEVLKSIMGPVAKRGVTKIEVDAIVKDAIDRAPKLSDQSCLPAEDHARLYDLHDAVATNRELAPDDIKFLWSTAWRLRTEEIKLRDKVDQTIAYMMNNLRSRVTFRA